MCPLSPTGADQGETKQACNGPHTHQRNREETTPPNKEVKGKTMHQTPPGTTSPSPNLPVRPPNILWGQIKDYLKRFPHENPSCTFYHVVISCYHYLIARLEGVNGFFVVFGILRDSTHGSPGGRRRGLPEKQEVGVGQKQKAGDPASPYKRVGVAHFLRSFVVVFLCLVCCVLDNFIFTLIHLGYPRSSFHPITSSSIHPNHPSLSSWLGYTYREHLR